MEEDDRMGQEQEAAFKVTIVHVGGVQKSYVATVTPSYVLVHPPMDTPHAFGLESGKCRTLREWSVERESLRRARAWSAIKYRVPGRARYVTGVRDV